MERLLSSIIILLLIGTAWSASNKSYCPPSSEIPKCRCQHRNLFISPGTAIICNGINTTKELRETVQKLRGYTIDLLVLGNIDIPFLPAGLSAGLSVRNLKISDSTVGNPYNIKEDNPSPFDGLEESLEELHIIRVKQFSQWYWPNLRNMKKLKTVEFTQSPFDFDFVNRVFNIIGNGSLQSLRISYSNISEIHPQAFSNLTNLSAVDLEGNSIVHMSRTMFPNPTPKLNSISLRFNKVDALPEDMFINMPALDSVDLSGNNIKTFPEKMYAPIWDRLLFINIGGNPFTCDCNLRWLRKKMDDLESPFLRLLQQFAVCSSPTHVAGLKLQSLSVDQLIC